MAQRRAAYPSALRTGVAHLAFSTSVFAALTFAVGGAVSLLGDADDAGPVVQLALFETPEAIDRPVLKARLSDDTIPDVRLAAMTPNLDRPVLEEPSLGIEYRPPQTASAGRSAERQPVVQRSALGPAPDQTLAEGSANQAVGVRINGRTVMPGEAFSVVRALESEDTASETDRSSPKVAALTLSGTPDVAAKAKASQTPFETNRNTFDNPAGLPTISVVLGGLGLNDKLTRTAIEELPAEITLSFSPHTRGLASWTRKARSAGHEVLIEIPMEAEEYGRIRPHHLTLQAGSSRSQTIARLDKLLSASDGYIGAINYQGSRFARNAALSELLIEALADRGLAFVEDGNLTSTNFAQTAGRLAMPFVAADAVIDTRIEADAMRDQLMALEARARLEGTALGTAIAYPVTIDALRKWAESASARGILLAPASHAASRRVDAASEATSAPSLLAPDDEAVTWEIVNAKPLTRR
ncbi:MAG: divergent polysaccharide deacetylase family protein [Pseudomonadota bacterium]